MSEAILSPCIGVCRIGPQGLCLGCARTLEEIAAWGSLSAAERERIMEELLPLRQAAPGCD